MTLLSSHWMPEKEREKGSTRGRLDGTGTQFVCSCFNREKHDTGMWNVMMLETSSSCCHRFCFLLHCFAWSPTSLSLLEHRSSDTHAHAHKGHELSTRKSSSSSRRDDYRRRMTAAAARAVHDSKDLGSPLSQGSRKERGTESRRSQYECQDWVSG